MSTSRTELLSSLRQMLHDLFEQRQKGAPEVRLARAHGYIDGYMRMMLDSQVATQSELLKLVAEEREFVNGPAMRSLVKASEVAA